MFSLWGKDTVILMAALGSTWVPASEHEESGSKFVWVDSRSADLLHLHKRDKELVQKDRCIFSGQCAK